MNASTCNLYPDRYKNFDDATVKKSLLIELGLMTKDSTKNIDFVDKQRAKELKNILEHLDIRTADIMKYLKISRDSKSELYQYYSDLLKVHNKFMHEYIGIAKDFTNLIDASRKGNCFY